ncbi:MAG: M48 family metalloprotease, partial [Acidilobus sp.]|nr:M48 family metalloprotease [Acidilobus sp.]
LMAAGVVFRFLVGNFNRLREYYADANAAMVTSPRSIQRALARLYVAMKGERYLTHQVNSTSSSILKMLFIVAPLVEIHGGFLYEPGHRWGPWRRSPDLGRYRSIDIDSIVESVKREKTSATEEVFATHPPIPKRLRFIDNLRYSLGLA